jgi:hypothetical protein
MDQSPDTCAGCGLAFTPVEQLWHPPDPYSGQTCGCDGHEALAENERRQHRLGRHRYRAWTKADAQAKSGELAKAMGR